MKSEAVSQAINSDRFHKLRAAWSGVCSKLLITGVLSVAVMSGQAHANPKYAGIVVDAKTGKVIYGQDVDEYRFPASLTKMMTLYLVFEALESGKIRLDTPVPISKNASMEPPSKLGVRAGTTITVEQGIQALVTRSANDAATALGEFLGGSEDRFARIMTSKARALGMTRTTYRNANGLPNSAQKTTARDQARLGIALRQHFPQYYPYFSTRSFKFGKQVIGNHNRLLGTVRGVDGIKTGYTNASGFNLVTSAQADGRSVVGVVLGGTSGGARDAQMRRLIEKYMPAASTRGGNGNLIAQTAPAPVVAQAAPASVPDAVEPSIVATVSGSVLPHRGPVPTVRYESDAPVEMAYAAPAKSNNPIVNRAVVISSLQEQQRQLESGSNPVATEVIEQVDSLTTASTSSAQSAGWVIQIGATPDKNQAMALLDTAKQKGGRALSQAKPFTVAFGDSGSQLYRARFSGFTGQTQALSACKALKNQGFACWASLQ
ncbi:serine hydrolase [Rhizobium sp. CFBP 8762]